MESRGGFPSYAGGHAPVATPVQERSEPRPYEGAWRFTVPAQDSSVPHLRREVRDLLRRRSGTMPEDTLYSVLLILSELVTNSVRHAALLSPEIGVEVSISDGWVRVAVEDGHPYRPKALAAAPDHDNTGGRGLLLVKMLAHEGGGVCDVEPTCAGGKVVWAAMPMHPG